MDWIGGSDEQFSSLLSMVRRQGITGRIASHVLSGDARISRIELSAALLTEGDQECIGFTIHAVTAARDASTGSGDHFKLELKKLSERIGNVPLPDLLRLAQAMMDRYLVSMGMQQSGGDASAAAILLAGSPSKL